MTSKRRRIAIVGAGPSGLSQLHFFKGFFDQIDSVICFERQAEWGGLWNYTPFIGFDPHGEPVHSSMYLQ